MFIYLIFIVGKEELQDSHFNQALSSEEDEDSEEENGQVSYFGEDPDHRQSYLSQHRGTEYSIKKSRRRTKLKNPQPLKPIDNMAPKTRKMTKKKGKKSGAGGAAAKAKKDRGERHKERAERQEQQATAQKNSRSTRREEEDESEYEDDLDNQNQYSEDESEDRPPSSKKRKVHHKDSGEEDADSDAEDEESDSTTENHGAGPGNKSSKDLRLLKQQEEIARLRSKIVETATKKKSKNGKKKLTILEKAIVSALKTCVWQRCKYIRNEIYLAKACKLCLTNLDLATLDGLDTETLQKEVDLFVATHKDLVRTQMNEHRNYVNGELKNFVEKLLEKGGTEAIPTKQEMEDLVLRRVSVPDFDLAVEEDDDETTNGEGNDATAEAAKATKARNLRMWNLLVLFWERLIPKITGGGHLEEEPPLLRLDEHLWSQTNRVGS